MTQRDLEQLLTDGRINGILAWALCSLFVATAVGSLLGGDYLWAAFAGVVGVVALTPALFAGDLKTMPPWEVVLLAGLPVVGRAVATLDVTHDVATYLSIAALALLVAVNLHLFTPVEMNYSFAILFVVVATLAAAGVWAVVRWRVDLLFGTELLLDPAVTEDEIEHRLMLEFAASAVAGLFGGLFFEGYVRRIRSRSSPFQEGSP
ncbi:MAG: hypothetical protein ABEJ40_06275 [Haloarculaceae archaeon]